MIPIPQKYRRQMAGRTRMGVLTVFCLIFACARGGTLHRATAPVEPAPLASPASVPVTAFVNVAVIPMDRERVLAAQTVVVRGDRIAAMGPANRVQVPAEAVRVDGRGKFLIPGLADMHAHLEGDNRDTVSLFLLLANGVTTIRNMFGSPKILRLRARAAVGELLSPRIYTAGPPLSTDSLPAALEQLAEQTSLTYDFFKIYDGMGSEVFDTVVTTARRTGRPIAGHVPASVGLERVLQAGYASIEHLNGYLGYLTGLQTQDTTVWRQAAEHFDTSKVRAIAVTTQRAGVWNCPTLVAWENMVMDSSMLAKQPGARYQPLEPSFMQTAFWQAVRNTATLTVLRLHLELKRKLIKPLHDAGAGLLLGTDGGSPAAIIGFSVHQELAALVRAGLTPYQALETGTRNVAVFYRTLDSTGTVAIGKRADLVLLSGNPLEDIHHTAQPAGVMVGGRWLSRADLDTRLAQLRQ